MPIDFHGFSVVNQSLDQFLESLWNEVRSDSYGPKWLACLNPHSYVVAKKDLVFKKALKNCNWLIPDGMGIVIASRLYGNFIPSRITGSDVFIGMMDKLNRYSGSVFFIGSTNETLKKIKDRVKIDYPNIAILGCYSPPYVSNFSTDEINTILSLVNASKPDVLWIGFGAPKQEKFIYKNIKNIDVKFCGAIGAVFDFYAGNIKRSPIILQNIGLEWVSRLFQEPNRIWPRVFISGPLFLKYNIVFSVKSLLVYKNLIFYMFIVLAVIIFLSVFNTTSAR